MTQLSYLMWQSEKKYESIILECRKYNTWLLLEALLSYKVLYKIV